MEKRLFAFDHAYNRQSDSLDPYARHKRSLGHQTSDKNYFHDLGIISGIDNEFISPLRPSTNNIRVITTVSNTN